MAHQDTGRCGLVLVDTAAIEIKYPREPRETNAAWTQHSGETLKDLYRLAHMPAEFTDRWCVQLLSTRMRRYLDGVANRHGVRLGLSPGETTVLDPAAVRGLPATAHRVLARWLEDLPAVTGTCVAAHRIGDDLRLTVRRYQEAPYSRSQPDHDTRAERLLRTPDSRSKYQCSAAHAVQARRGRSRRGQSPRAVAGAQVVAPRLLPRR